MGICDSSSYFAGMIHGICIMLFLLLVYAVWDMGRKVGGSRTPRHD